jgi:hypothetical protein
MVPDHRDSHGSWLRGGLASWKRGLGKILFPRLDVKGIRSRDESRELAHAVAVPGGRTLTDPGIATALGLSLAAGFNAWATALVFGFCARIFPDLLVGHLAQFFASGPILTMAAALFAAEFLAEKIPFLDHFWDFAHTFLRPAAGAALAAACLPTHGLAARAGMAAAGAAVTLAAHLGKAASRLTSTAAVSSVMRLTLSLSEDVIAVSVAAVAIFSPELSLAVVGAVLILIVLLFGRVRRAAAILFFLAAHPRAALRASREA